MKSICPILVFLLLIVFGMPADPKPSIEAEITSLRSKVEMVQANQINYQIEKDLLKQTYESNFQTINMVLTIILAVFTVIGYFGFRDISSLRSEYKKELDSLLKIRETIDTKVSEIAVKQEAITKESVSIRELNEEQNKRIKILEIQEKAASLITSQNYQRALEYLAIASELDANNVLILTQKGTCYWRVLNYPAAIEVYERLVEVDRQNVEGYQRNLAELYLFSRDFEKYTKLINGNPNLRNLGEELTLGDYFDVLHKFLLGENTTSIITEKLKVVKEEKKNYIPWQYIEMQMFLNKQKADPGKKALLLFCELLSGAKLPSEVLAELN